MKQRLIINEDERNEILSLHKKFISEQQAGPQNWNQVDNNKDNVPDYLQQTPEEVATKTQEPVQATASTQTPVQTTASTQTPVQATASTQTPVQATASTQTPVQSTMVQKGIKNPKVETLQNKLNEKFKSGLVIDGKWGPKTAEAVKKALQTLNTVQPNAGANDVKSSTTA